MNFKRCVGQPEKLGCFSVVECGCWHHVIYAVCGVVTIVLETCSNTVSVICPLMIGVCNTESIEDKLLFLEPVSPAAACGVCVAHARPE